LAVFSAEDLLVLGLASAGADLAGVADFTAVADFAVAVDLVAAADFAAVVDLADVADLAGVAGLAFATVADLVLAPDLDAAAFAAVFGAVLELVADFVAVLAGAFDCAGLLPAEGVDAFEDIGSLKVSVVSPK
jgi:hypothetical protein